MSINLADIFQVDFFYEPEDGSGHDILLIEDQTKVQPFHVRFTKLTNESVKFEASTDETPSASNYHFEIDFGTGILNNPPGITLLNAEIITQQSSQFSSQTLENAWRFQYILQGGDKLYLCWVGEDLILDTGASIDFSFEGVVAKNPEARTPASVTVTCKPMTQQESSASEGEESYNQQSIIVMKSGNVPPPVRKSGSQALKIVKMGKPNIPLDIRFVGSNRVINLNSEESHLKVRIANIANPNNPELAILFNYDIDSAKSSKLILSLEVGDAATIPWALATKDQLSGIELNISDSRWQRSSATEVTRGKFTFLEWTLTPTENIEFKPDDSLEIEMKKIVSHHPTGATKLFVRYEFVPDYRDGELVSIIEKTPLVFHDASVNSHLDYRVGIGTTTPAESLHIKAGNLRLEHTDRAINGEIQTAGTLVLRSNADEDKIEDLAIKFYDRSSTDPLMVLHKEGKLGIGTTTPSAKLHVDGGDAIIMSGKVGIGTETPSAKLHIDGGDAIIMSGNVGIGTETPKQKLHVAGDYYGKGHIWLYANEGDGKSGTAYIQARDDSEKSTSEKSTIDLKFRTQKEGKIQEVMHLDSDGNVGIGMKNPSAKLHVSGDATITDGLNVSGMINTYKQLGFLSSAYYPMRWNIAPYFTQDETKGLLEFAYYNADNKLLANSWIAADGTYVATSDERLKQDIEPISNVLERVMKLQPSSYYWRNSKNKSLKSFGFIAQNVETVFPNFVGENSGFKGLNYNNFTVLAIAAIKEQQQLILCIQEEINTLKAQL